MTCRAYKWTDNARKAGKWLAQAECMGNGGHVESTDYQGFTKLAVLYPRLYTPGKENLRSPDGQQRDAPDTAMPVHHVSL